MNNVEYQELKNKLKIEINNESFLSNQKKIAFLKTLNKLPWEKLKQLESIFKQKNLKLDRAEKEFQEKQKQHALLQNNFLQNLFSKIKATFQNLAKKQEEEDAEEIKKLENLIETLWT